MYRLAPVSPVAISTLLVSSLLEPPEVNPPEPYTSRNTDVTSSCRAENTHGHWNWSNRLCKSRQWQLHCMMFVNFIVPTSLFHYLCHSVYSVFNWHLFLSLALSLRSLGASSDGYTFNRSLSCSTWRVYLTCSVPSVAPLFLHFLPTRTDIQRILLTMINHNTSSSSLFPGHLHGMILVLFYQVLP